MTRPPPVWSRAVAYSLAEVDGRAVLAVTDDGPGDPAGPEERLFERFARLDEARAGVAGGTGLGLAIAGDVALRHGGSVVVDDAHTSGARSVFDLPSA